MTPKLPVEMPMVSWLSQVVNELAVLLCSFSAHSVQDADIANAGFISRA